jgi:hypothetical protein
VACLLKARIVKPVDTAVGMERLCKHTCLLGSGLVGVTYAAMEELLEAVFSVRSVPKLYNGDQPPNPSGGGVEYLHHGPAIRRRRRKRKSQI